MRLAVPHRLWRSQCFYLKNVASSALPEHALPEFSGLPIEAASERWKWGLGKKELRKIKDHLAVIMILKDAGLNRASVIRAYHQLRVALLMARALPLHQMDPHAPLGGTVLSKEPITSTEVAERIKDAMDSQQWAGYDFQFPVPGCPSMRPKSGFIEFVSFLHPRNSFCLGVFPFRLCLTIPYVAVSAVGTYVDRAPGAPADGGQKSSEPHGERGAEVGQGGEEEGCRSKMGKAGPR